MQITISYTEIRHYLQRHHQTDFGIEYLDSKTLRISHKPHTLSPVLRVDIRLQRLNEQQALLIYNGKSGVNTLIKAILLFFGSNIDNDIVEVNTKTRQIRINLSSIPAAQKSFKSFGLEDIYFEKQEAVMLLSLK